jgi:hypothetical protein
MSDRQRPPLLYVLAALIFLEGVALAATAIYLVVEIFASSSTATPTASVPSAVALAVCAALAAAGLILIALFTIRGRPWTRGAAVCWQIIQLLVAYSVLTATVPTASDSFTPALGWALIVPAVVIVVLIFTPPVMRATARPPR